MQTAFFPQFTPQQNVPSGSSFQSKRKRQSWTQEDFAYESSKVSYVSCSRWVEVFEWSLEKGRRKQHLSFLGRNERLEDRLSGVPSSASHPSLSSSRRNTYDSIGATTEQAASPRPLTRL